METLQFLTTIIEQNHFLAYLIIYVGLIFEGEIIIISTGILAHLGALNFWASLVFIVLGGFSKTFMGYALGAYLSRRHNHNRFFKYIQKQVNNFLPTFKQKPFWSIFVSKFIMGANHLVIIFSGFERINYKKFLQAEITSTLIWAPALLTLGYLFSFTAFHVSHEVSRFLIIVLVFVTAFILFDKLVSFLYKVFEEFYNGPHE